VTLRLFFVYGPWEHGRRLIPRLMLSTLRGRPMGLSSPDVSRADGRGGHEFSQGAASELSVACRKRSPLRGI
jgi:hypothetical protein